MNRMMILIVAAWLGVATASAQEWAKARLEKSPRHLEWVKVKHGNREVNCFIAYPEVKDKATAIVVIHEIFGLSDWVRGVADQLAEAGYIAIAPDLLSGTAPAAVGTAELGGDDAVRKAISSLPSDQITSDLNAVVDYVAKRPPATARWPVGGFCWGGGQTFRLATNNKNMRAAFAFYGTGPDKEEDIARINCSVYGFYGGNDERVNATIPKSDRADEEGREDLRACDLRRRRPRFHARRRSPDANEPNKKAREEAWKRLKDLLKEDLGLAPLDCPRRVKPLRECCAS